jgi:hypothetical protein
VELAAASRSREALATLAALLIFRVVPESMVQVVTLSCRVAKAAREQAALYRFLQLVAARPVI